MEKDKVMKNNVLIGLGAYLAVITFGLYVVFMQVFNSNALLWIHEDGIVENLTVIFYLLAFIIFMIFLNKKGIRNIWYLILGVLCFLMAGEELSWGQRIFGFVTPELLKQINYQQEVNIHNIKLLHIRAIGLLTIIGFFFFIPLTERFSSKLRALYQRLKIPVYPLWAIGIPAVIMLTHVVPKLFFGKYSYIIEEVGEVSLSFAFFIFAVSEYLKKFQANSK